ncbi:plasmid pRiA4b ORF-3 family protein [Mesobacillus maritimus]|uniref:plasmid pRiA4b ORF-3 family protein n=1 Tax=Mesobacillus maritimus TaxID=1643336 RepID=UPI0020400FFA|nr:plasmid pRiA4b ORF-3 family protein [Mesobacillus maritimus]MCM3670971.1 plasmid pRiA4b ORF-3 family protein [Mesobacillus maritimus]
MLIQCTKKLLDQLGVKPVSGVEGDPLFSWHANLLVINRRKTLVLVNDATRYVVVLYGLKGKDFNKIDELIVQGIRESLLLEGIKEEVIEKYLMHSEGFTFTKTKDRKHVARMNRACESVHFFSEYIEPETIFNNKLSNKVSRLLVGEGKSYVHPYEEMYKYLEEFAGQPIFGSKAVQLKVTLKLENQSVWRRIVVPLNRSFPQLHEILQTAFGWSDSHLHEFRFYEDEKQSTDPGSDFGLRPSPMLTLVCTNEAFDYPRGYEMKLETGVLLSEYLPAHQKLTYTYDLGDDWEHQIEVEKIVEEYVAPYPVCLAGEGNTPPEDVGGSYGYEEFLSILSNPDHPDFEHMLRWGRSQGYQEFDLEQINRNLKQE